MKRMYAAACAVLVGTSVFTSGAHAAAYSFVSTPTAFDTQLSLGFTFIANVTTTVDSLGYYDLGGDGFLTEHEVGIYLGDGADGPGTLLVSTTLAAGTVESLGADSFRYKSIAPLTLIAGNEYTIAGLSPLLDGNDAWNYGSAASIIGFAVDPRITIPADAARYTYFPGASLVNPSSHFGDYQVYAVNFGLVPEPASWAMMIIGFGLVGTTLRRRSAVVA